MAKKQNTKRPAGVPEENVYNGTHWTLFVGFLAVILTLYLVLGAG